MSTLILPCLCGIAPSALAQPAPAANAGSAAPIQKQMADLKVKRCANTFELLGQSLTLGATYTMEAYADRTAPDSHVVQAVAGLAYNQADYQSQAVGVIVAAPTSTGCEGNFVRVAPFQKSCRDVAALLPKGSQLARDLSGTPLYNLGDNQGQALLVSSGTSCVVVSVASAMDRQRSEPGN